MDCTRDGSTMRTKLNLIAEIARRDKRCKIDNVAYLLNESNLNECFWMLKDGKATGIDGVGLEEYGKQLDTNLCSLVDRMKRNTYRPQRVRRTYIPKANGKLRPLGIPATEDKIVQKGIARILESIYEQDFLDFSYGFRPGRGCHQALGRLDKIIMTLPVNHVIDADIKGFFDNVSHEWMLRFLSHRVSDRNFLRLIARFLKNGYMEDGRAYNSEAGTPQGGIVSPVLANIYLHYALDLWVERVVKPHCRGAVEIVRYADDFVICVQYGDEAEKILKALKGRLAKFGLELAEDKTRIIEFGRVVWQEMKRGGKKPSTFNFLGFTHFVDRTRTGGFKLGRMTDRKKLTLKLKEMNLWLKHVRNCVTIQEWWQILNAKLTGHFRYYGVSGNSRSISTFYYLVLKLVYKWINRRSQKSSMDWTYFNVYLKRHTLSKPRIYCNLYSLYNDLGECC